MDNIGVLLENKFRSLEDQLQLLSRQMEVQQPFLLFLKQKFQLEFEDFVKGQEQVDVTDCCGSSVGDDNPEFAEAPGHASTLSTDQQDGQREDFEEEKFHPSGFVAPAQPEFRYAEFEKAMGLNNVDSPSEVPSHLEISIPLRFEHSNSPSPSSSGVRRLQQHAEDDTQGSLPKLPCRMKLRRSRPNASAQEQTATRVDTAGERTPSERSEEDSLASGGTSVDSKDSLESREEFTEKRGVGIKSRKTRLVRKKLPEGLTVSAASASHPQKQNQQKEKLFQCGVCAKRFSYAVNLREHELIHTNERPYECSYCQKRFRQAGTLRDHEMIHTKKKPHKCSHCEMRFRQGTHRSRHELIHTKKHPHKCSLCSKGFRDRTELRRHERTHRPPQ